MIGLLWFAIGAAALVLFSLSAALVLALHDLSRGRLEELAERKDDDAVCGRVQAIIDDPEDHTTAAAVPCVVFGLTAAVACVMWVGQLRGQAMPDATSVVAGIVVAVGVIWLLGVVLPLSLAEHAGERLVLAASRPLRWLHGMALPLRAVARAVDEGIRRLSGSPERAGAEQIEQELMDVVEEHGLSEEFGEEEREMLEAVVEFRSTTVGEIMTPRTDIEGLEYTDDPDEVKRMMDERKHSRVPVYEDNLDHMVGMLYAKDLLHWIVNHGENGRTFVLRELLRPAIFFPETKSVRALLTDLLAQQVHVAMVADEYGGTSGLVTLEDIIEEVFGEIADEYEEPDEQPSIAIDPELNAADLDARVEIDDANDELERLDIEIPERDDYDTVGGFVVVGLGRIPIAGDAFTLDGLAVRVLEAEPTRVVRVRVERAGEDAPGGDVGEHPSLEPGA